MARTELLLWVEAVEKKFCQYRVDTDGKFFFTDWVCDLYDELYK